MAFSTATITHTYLNADGTSASGSIKWTLTDSMTNGTSTIVPASVTSNLSSTGVLSQALTSNVDTATWSLTSSASSGAFTLSVSGQANYGTQTTASLNYNATATQVAAALDALYGLSALTASGGPLGTAVTIANVPGNLTLAIASSTLSGGTASVTQTASGTVPAAPLNTQWKVDIDILGCQVKSYFITVPAGGGSYDLGSLLPTTPQVN